MGGTHGESRYCRAACTSPCRSPVWTNSMKPDEKNICSSIATRKTHGHGTPLLLRRATTSVCTLLRGHAELGLRPDEYQAPQLRSEWPQCFLCISFRHEPRPCENQPTAPITAVTVFVLHPGAGPDFMAAIKKVNEALGKQADWPKTSGWLQLVNGGEGPTFVLLSSRKNWAG
jgi:hypothetical protein